MKLLKLYSNILLMLVITVVVSVCVLPQSAGDENTSPSQSIDAMPGNETDAAQETLDNEEPIDAVSEEETTPEDELGDYREIVEKNIFGFLATAQPQQALPEIMEPLPILPEGAFEQQQAPATVSLKLSVTGIMTIGEKEKRVILKDEGSGRGFYLGIGGEALDARVVEINKDSVVMESTDGARTTLYIVEKKPSALIPYDENGKLIDMGKTEPEEMPSMQRSRYGR